MSRHVMAKSVIFSPARRSRPEGEMDPAPRQGGGFLGLNGVVSKTTAAPTRRVFAASYRSRARHGQYERLAKSTDASAAQRRGAPLTAGGPA